MFAMDYMVDGFQHSLCILQHIGIPETQYFEALFFHKAGTGFIFLAVCFLRMLPTVQFDNELRTQTGKVSDVSSYRMLPTEFNAHLFSTQQVP